MNTEEFNKYLKERYEDQINWYDRKAIWNQKMYKRFQSIVIIFAAVTPILVATGIEQSKWPAVAISAIVAIGTAFLKSFKYQENWVSYRTTCETMRKEIFFYEAGIGDYKNTDDKESLFVERAESLISRENTMWLTTLRPKEKEGKS